MPFVRFQIFFNHYLFECFLASHSFFCLSVIQMIQMLDSLLLSHRSLRLCSFFFSFWVIFCRVSKFCWSILKFTDSMLCHLLCTIESIQWVSFILAILEFPVGYFLYPLILWWDLLFFSFQENSSLFIKAFLWWLIYPCQRIPTTESCHYRHQSMSFLVQIVIFLVLDMASDFQLYSGHLSIIS